MEAWLNNTEEEQSVRQHWTLLSFSPSPAPAVIRYLSLQGVNGGTVKCVSSLGSKGCLVQCTYWTRL